LLGLDDSWRVESVDLQIEDQRVEIRLTHVFWRVLPRMRPPFPEPMRGAWRKTIVPLDGAAQNIVPVAVTAGDKIEQLRQWASGRCLSADRAGVYSREQQASSGGRVRRVVREPGRN